MYPHSILGVAPEGRQDSDQLRNHGLLYDAYCAEEDGNREVIYEMLQPASISLTETLLLEKHFGKPNNNIVNELDEWSEQTLFFSC